MHWRNLAVWLLCDRLWLQFAAADRNLARLHEDEAPSRSLETEEDQWEMCRLMALIRDSDGPDLDEEITWGCEVEATGIIYEVDPGSQTPDWMQESIQSGELMQNNMIISRNELAVNKQNAQFSLTSRSRPSPHRLWKRQLSRDLASTEGTKKVLIVGVIAEADGVASTADNHKMSDSVFGTHGDKVTLSSQYAKCSEKRLIFEPAENRTGVTGIQIVNGAVTIPISTELAVGHGKVRNAVTEALEKEFNVTSVKELADFALYCLPPGIPGFRHAFAYINGWISWYNDMKCTYATFQLHEIGHNLALGHAGHDKDHPKYGDEAGYMGFSWSKDDGPRACFNGANFYQLGWFADDCQRDIHTIDKPLTMAIIGFARPSSQCRGRNKNKVVRIVHPETVDKDLYVAFNLKRAHNIGTHEYGNMVTVVTKENGPYDYGSTNLEAHIDRSESFTFDQQAFSPGCAIVIAVKRIDRLRGQAVIEIHHTGGCGS